MSVPTPQTEKSPVLEPSKNRRLMFVVLILASLFCLANNVADPDLWGHVQFGRDVVRGGAIQPTTTYSYTANGYRWINHENLSELVLALTYDNLGLIGLIAGKFCLAILILSLIAWCAVRNGIRLIIAGLTACLVSINLASFWHFRPQISSFVCCALLLTILETCFRDWQAGVLGRGADPDAVSAANLRFSKRLKWLWLAPVVLFFWANSHGGFVAGLAIFGAYIGGRIIELVLYRGKHAYGLSLRLAVIGIAGLLATLINPYGPDLHLWLLSSLGQPRPEIQDWLSVDFTSANGIRFAMILSISAIALATPKSNRDWTKVAILVLVAWQACSHVRHIAFFSLLFGFWMPVHLQGLLQQFKASFSQDEKPETKVSSGASLQWCMGAVATLMLGMIGFRMQDIPVDKAAFPVDAFQYIADKNLDGRMVVTYNWAQYAIGAFGGEHKRLPVCPVSFDGRFRTCYPQEIVDMNFDFVIQAVGPDVRFRGEDSGPVDTTKVLEFGQPELVLISRRQKPSVAVMELQSDRWCLLYQDAVAQLWGVKSRFDDPESGVYVSQTERMISDQEQSGTVAWPALPSGSRIDDQPSELASR